MSKHKNNSAYSKPNENSVRASSKEQGVSLKGNKQKILEESHLTLSSVMQKMVSSIKQETQKITQRSFKENQLTYMVGTAVIGLTVLFFYVLFFVSPKIPPKRVYQTATTEQAAGNTKQQGSSDLVIQPGTATTKAKNGLVITQGPVSTDSSAQPAITVNATPAANGSSGSTK